jgi:membrane protein
MLGARCGYNWYMPAKRVQELVARIDQRYAVRPVLAAIKRDRITITAAGVAFYWFLAIFPLLYAAIALLANAQPSLVQTIAEAIRTGLPGGAASTLNEALTHAQDRAAGQGGLTAGVLALVIAVWSASSGMVATQVGLDVAYGAREDRPFLKRRLVALLLIGIALVLGGVAIALIVAGQPLGEAALGDVSGGASFPAVWTLARWALALLAITVLLAVFYAVGPNRAVRPRLITAGGVVATAIWALASLGLSLYTSHLGSTYARTYGALAGAVVLLLWLYLSAIAILVGAEVNAELERQAAARPAGAERTRSDRVVGSKRT